MGCLIQLTYTKKASEKEYGPFFLKHTWFFANCTMQSVKKNESGQYVVQVYIVHHQNSASKYMVEVLNHERRLEETRIIS